MTRDRTPIGRRWGVWGGLALVGLLSAFALVRPAAAAGTLVASVSHSDGSMALGHPHQRRLVRDGSGYWYVIWMDLDGADGAGSTGLYEIQMSKSLNTAGTSWSAPVEVAGDTGILYTTASFAFYHPTIEIDRASGALHVLLIRLTTGGLLTYDDHLIYSKITDLTNWDQAGSWYQLDGITNGYDTPVTDAYCQETHGGYAHTLGLDSGGNVHIGYATGLKRDPYYIHGSVGSGWDTPIQLDATSENHLTPTVEVDANDVVHFIWTEHDGSFYRYIYHRSATGPAYNSFAAAALLVNAPSVHVDFPSLAADDEGNLHLTAVRRATGELVGSYYDGATWTGIDPISSTGWDRPQVGVLLGAGITDDVILAGNAGADPRELLWFTWSGSGWDTVTNALTDTDTAISLEKRAPAGSAEFGFVYFEAGAGTGDIYFSTNATTAVELTWFDALSLDGAVKLHWRTGSELHNLGFHLYRATSEAGPYQRVTEQVIPGLGSSPAGADYEYRDSGTGILNGTTYYYKLEDIETTGETTFHGPVSARPKPGLGEASSDAVESRSARITYGNPLANAFEIIEGHRGEVILELDTSGFYAEILEDGGVRLIVPGLDAVAAGSSIPVKQAWVDAIAGRKVELVSVEASELEAIELGPTGSEVDELVASMNGTVRLRRRRAPPAAALEGTGLVPAASARIASVGFQGGEKKALMEMAPLRWEASKGRMLLTKRLRVRVAFRGAERLERRGHRYRRAASHADRQVLARLITREEGLYGVTYEEAFGRRRFGAGGLRLSRQGQAVAYHLEPQGKPFGPGSKLYFLSGGAALNRYGLEAVYELERSDEVETMEVVSTTPSGEPLEFYRHEVTREQNHYYQAALVNASDLWLWDLVMSGTTKAFPFEVSELAGDGGGSRLTVELQGTSDFPESPDHHLRAYLNGILAGETRWDGKRAMTFETELLPGVLRNGENVLELENVGDTAAAYSMVMLNRFSVSYSRRLVASEGKLEGGFATTGVAEIRGMSQAYILDLTDETPRWLVGGLPFHAQAGHRYAVVSPEALRVPEVRHPSSSSLKSTPKRADYIAIGSREFLQTAGPLLSLRQSQGLHVLGVATEEIYSEFGFGEPTPEAIRDFLSYGYHHWERPSPRYVVLLGDATYDYKDELKTGVANQLPPRMIRTTYLWTASDPSYAAVNGEDILPDLAIGRLPAANADELRVMVDKILTYERSEVSSGAPIVLVTDNGDAAGEFERDAREIVSTLPDPHRVLHLSDLGTEATREEIVRAFDEGASIVSYIGHGGINLWANENLFDTASIASLSEQSQQPLVLTMNCLNGYFHFPYFDSLSEALVKAEHKGAIAAFSPSGMSLNDPADRYHRALLAELLDSRHPRLGDAVLAAQAAYARTGAFPELLQIYHLLGDPALTLR